MENEPAEDEQAQDGQGDRWHIEAFGELRLCRNGREVPFRFPTRKMAALLVYLALNNSAPHSYQRLITEFWPNAEGLGSLHHALSGLRKLLEPPGTRRGSILRSNPAVALATVVTTDVTEFEEARRTAKEAGDPSQKIAALTHMTQLYRGELLPGHNSPWFNVQREYWRRMLLENIRQLVALLEARGRFEEALRHSERAVGIAPRSEEACADLIRVLNASGQADEARRECRNLLAWLRQKRREPSPVTRDLAAGLLYAAGGITKAPQTGPHVETQSIELQTIETQAPPETPGTILAKSTILAEPPDLPVYLAPFFGREYLLDEIALRLLAPSPKWVTLTGLGGVGKTRLAREAAAQMPVSYASARTFVSLTEVETPDRIVPTISHALHLPHTKESASLDAVVAALEGKHALLVLDNMEHLATEGASVIEALLRRAPGLAVLVTSRFALGREHEQAVLVETLPTPLPSDSPEQFQAYASVRLFVERARRAKPGFQITVGNMQAVAELCRSLDGIPLAIELAAARMSSLEPAEMLARLSHRFDFLVSDQAYGNDLRGRASASVIEGNIARTETRHQSLWNAIGGSYHLLPLDVQRFFRVLSVFRGGWSVDHAKAVAAEPLAGDYLQELEKQSLVITAPGPARRFLVLETLREYGAANLSGTERVAIQGRHLDYFLGWADRARAGLSGAGQSLWLERLDRDHDNLRTALQWCAAQNEPGEQGERRRGVSTPPASRQSNLEPDPLEPDRAELGLRLAERLWEFWNLHAHWTEGRRWLNFFLERTKAQGTTFDRASAYNGAGVLAIQQGDYAAARRDLLTSLEMARSLGPKMEGDVLGSLGYLASKPDNVLDVPKEARAEVILAKYRQAIQEQPGQSKQAHAAELATFWPLLGLGKHELELGNRSAANSFFKESLAVCEKFGDKQGMSHPLTFLAQIACDQGNFDAARDYLRRGLRLRQELKDVAGIAVCLEQLGRLAHDQQHWEQCVRLYGAAWAVRVLTGASVAGSLREYQRQTDPAEARLGGVAFLAQWQEGSSLTRDQALIFSPENGF